MLILTTGTFSINKVTFQTVVFFHVLFYIISFKIVRSYESNGEKNMRKSARTLIFNQKLAKMSI